jgi:prepilin-type N-terminal cleavage/methylation domain-containing protein
MDRSGFSLIEALIAVAVAAIGALAVSSFLAYQTNASANLNSLTDFSELKSEIELFTGASNNVCASLFAGNTFPNGPAASTRVPIVFKGPLQNVIVAGKSFGTLKVNSIEFTGFAFLGATNVGPKSYSATLQVQTTGLGGAMSKQRTSNIMMILNIAGGAATACNYSSIPSLASLSCIDWTQSAVFAITLSCPPNYPYAMTGGCTNTGCWSPHGSPMTYISSDYIINGNTINCGIEGEEDPLDYCVNGGQYNVTATLRCCK